MFSDFELPSHIKMLVMKSFILEMCPETLYTVSQYLIGLLKIEKEKEFMKDLYDYSYNMTKFYIVSIDTPLLIGVKSKSLDF
jgi:hypothetical protein